MIRCMAPARLAGLVTTALCVLVLLADVRAQEVRPVRIGFVQDGPSERNGLLRLAVERELRELLDGEFEVSFPAESRRVANWTVAGVTRTVNEALDDDGVDVLVALGTATSHEMLDRELPRPVVAARLLDAARLGIEGEGRTSAVPNLAYVDIPTRGMQTAEAFADLAGVRNVAVVIHDLYRDILAYLPVELDPAVSELGVALQFVWVSGGPDAILRALPDDVDGVVLAPTLHLSNAQSRALAEGFIERRLPSFSLLGSSDVELGHLATLSPDSDSERLARRLALNVQRILLGEKPEDLEVAFDTTTRLTLNIDTARAIRVWPRFDLLIDAQLVNPEPEPSGPSLTITDAVREAMSMNLDLRSVEHLVQAAIEDVDVANAALWPQIDAAVSYTMIDRDRAAAGNGSLSRRTWEAALRLEQLLWNEPALADIDVSELTATAQGWFQQEQILDVTEATARQYLDVLRARTLARIRNDDVELTRSNLELAETRQRIGVADRQEVYRWQSRLATSKSNAIDAHAQESVAEVLLARLLARSLGESLGIEETGLDDPDLFPTGRSLEEAIGNPWSMRIFEDYIVERALINSPELRQLDAQVDVQERIELSRRRAFTNPTASVFAEVSRQIGRGGEFPPAPGITLADREDWTAGLSLSLPLYQGGFRRASVRSAVESVNQVTMERAATALRIEQDVRANMRLAQASFTSIRLTEQAAEAARNNLDLVRDAYAQGVLSILDLLDAQNSALTARLEAAAAVYDFLIDLMAVQRSAGEFHVFLSPEGQAAWEADVYAALRRAGVASNGSPSRESDP